MDKIEFCLRGCYRNLSFLKIWTNYLYLSTASRFPGLYYVCSCWFSCGRILVTGSGTVSGGGSGI